MSGACSGTQYAFQALSVSAFSSSLGSHAVGVVDPLSTPFSSLSSPAVADIMDGHACRGGRSGISLADVTRRSRGCEM